MNAVECFNATETGRAGTVAALLEQIKFQAEGRDKAMDMVQGNVPGSDNKIPAIQYKLNDYDDVTEKVICKLTALTEIFEFYQYTKGMTDFRTKTIPGLCYILDGCVDDLEGLKK
jgi:hypothetical protein